MKFKSIALLFLAGLVLVGCGKKQAAHPADAPPTIVVGHVGHDHQIALYIAALEGEAFIQKHGVGLRMVKDREQYDLVDGGKILARLRLVKVGGGAKMPAALARGEIEIGLGGVPAIAKLADSQTDNPVKIICPLQTDGDMLVLKTADPAKTWTEFIATRRAADKPITIGYKAPMAVAMLVFQRALDHEKIVWGDKSKPGVKVVLLNMKGGKNAIPLISSGAIDGFVMNQPIVALAESKGLGKTVAHLNTLPPAGKWNNHPCCCACAPQNTLTDHPQAVKAFLKIIQLGTRLIATDPKTAIQHASTWTKKPLAVETASVPTITYNAMPNPVWWTGMNTWATMMVDVKLYTGRYATMSSAEILKDLCQFDLCEQAAKELNSNPFKK